MKTLILLSQFVLSIAGLCNFSTYCLAQDDPSKALTSAFKLNATADANFAQGLSDGSYYIQLGIKNLRTDLSGQKCVDTGFSSWIRKFFKTDNDTITLIASITLPDNTIQKIPLFEISKNEQSKPPQCITKILDSEAITPQYVGCSWRIVIAPVIP